MQQSDTARNPAIWVENSFVIMAVHGLIRLADGLRLPPEFDPLPRRTPLMEMPAPNEAAQKTLADIATFFSLDQAPGVFRAMASRPLYLRATWDFVRRALEPDLLSAEQKRLIAFAVSVAAGSDYGIDLFAHDARRLGASEDVIFDTLAVVHRFAGLTKFATSLNLEPDRVPEF